MFIRVVLGSIRLFVVSLKEMVVMNLVSGMRCGLNIHVFLTWLEEIRFDV
jgi:hypothetical protein